ncbi:uncharacterized protein P884DRAFT_257606 [Thermothelomyces heterothallicus CBS 202.75]|uniref:uncharacterized protein n=1 Tax=Thermothelomyces heterothallicus CBS 202.75 TaxID=1149848 RepID=UPI003742AF22
MMMMRMMPLGSACRGESGTVLGTAGGWGTSAVLLAWIRREFALVCQGVLSVVGSLMAAVWEVRMPSAELPPESRGLGVVSHYSCRMVRPARVDGA